jgi:hypothetical protein
MSLETTTFKRGFLSTSSAFNLGGPVIVGFQHPILVLVLHTPDRLESASSEPVSLFSGSRYELTTLDVVRHSAFCCRLAPWSRLQGRLDPPNYALFNATKTGVMYASAELRSLARVRARPHYASCNAAVRHIKSACPCDENVRV